MIKTGSELGTEVCKALGLNPDCIRSIGIRMVAGDVATVMVERHITHTEAKDIVTAFDLYALLPKPEELTSEQIKAQDKANAIGRAIGKTG